MYIVVGNKTQTMSHPINTTRKIILKAVPILIFLVLSLVNWGTNGKRRFLDMLMETKLFCYALISLFEIKKFIGDKTSFIHHRRYLHSCTSTPPYLWDYPTRVFRVTSLSSSLKFFIHLIWNKVGWIMPDTKIVIVNIILKKINDMVKY